jgi:ribosomal protein S18 acetylase RimI-like enzyme
MLKVRAFQPEDIVACSRLFVAIFREPPWHDRWPSLKKAQGYLQDIVDTPGFRGFMAWQEEANGEELVGFALGHVTQWWDGNEFRVDELGVDPERQRQGIGHQLLLHMERELRAKGCVAIVLLTLRNAPAQRFYQKHGFQLTPHMIFMAKEL